ncbi:uncharacterized mitochondrial protein AtMg00310-like [Mercurialis annua]|uniref:uncharacterized mitochondrial protein AtMg00310-like n=1 Tax=Mercurialis annua TaxID=3986 RepID=UPI00215E21FC|nr:uncharacterized mitochondrial protein AtMg00310-like [Mercurialis annua]
MCKAKCEGGMGFKDLQSFNKALLAKQGWNLLKNPDSLLARIWKQRYFKDGNFLNAGCPRMASYTWKSLMWAREVLVEGLRWRVGSGRDILIYRDKWLPRESTFRVFSPPVLGLNARVSDLMAGDGI